MSRVQQRTKHSYSKLMPKTASLTLVSEGALLSPIGSRNCTVNFSITTSTRYDLAAYYARGICSSEKFTLLVGACIRSLVTVKCLMPTHAVQHLVLQQLPTFWTVCPLVPSKMKPAMMVSLQPLLGSWHWFVAPTRRAPLWLVEGESSFSDPEVGSYVSQS